VILGLIGGTNGFLYETSAQENPRGKDKGNDVPIPVPLNTICFDKTLQEWVDEGFNLVRGTDHRDKLKGTDGNDIIAGGDGPDKILAGDGDDVVCGGDGTDFIIGGDGEDMVDGEGGSDIIKSGDDDDIIFAVDGEEDNIHGGDPKNSDTCIVDGDVVGGEPIIEEKSVKGCETIIIDGQYFMIAFPPKFP